MDLGKVGSKESSEECEGNCQGVLYERRISLQCGGERYCMFELLFSSSRLRRKLAGTTYHGAARVVNS